MAGLALPAETLRLFALSALIKLTLMGLLYAVTGGAEMAEDWDLHMAMGGNPALMHFGGLAEYRQFPPLIGYLLWPGAALSEAIGTWWGLRLWFLFFDMAALWFVLASLPQVAGRNLLILIGCWTIVPYVPFTSFVMIQDEMVATMLVAVSLYLLTQNKPALAMLASVLGVAGGKIFMLFSLGGFGVRLKALTALLGIGGMIAALSYGPFLLGMDQVEAFDPVHVPFGVSYTTLFDKYGYFFANPLLVTGLSFLVAVVLVLLSNVNLLPAQQYDPVAFYAGLFAIIQLLFCNLFYHVTQEYYVLIAPALAVFYLRRSEAMRMAFLFVLLSWNWVTNFAYGIEVASHREHVPALFKMLNQIIPIDPVLLHSITLAMGVLINVAVLVMVYKDVRTHLGSAMLRAKISQ